MTWECVHECQQRGRPPGLSNAKHHINDLLPLSMTSVQSPLRVTTMMSHHRATHPRLATIENEYNDESHTLCVLCFCVQVTYYHSAVTGESTYTVPEGYSAWETAHGAWAAAQLRTSGSIKGTGASIPRTQ